MHSAQTRDIGLLGLLGLLGCTPSGHSSAGDPNNDPNNDPKNDPKLSHAPPPNTPSLPPKDNDGATPAVDQQAEEAAPNLAIDPNFNYTESLDDIRLGMSMTELLVAAPNYRAEGPSYKHQPDSGGPPPSYRQSYKQSPSGLSITTESSAPKTAQHVVYIMASFSGSTAKGIGIGSTRREMKRAYPAVFTLKRGSGQWWVHINDHEMFWFAINKGRISKIHLGPDEEPTYIED